MTSTPSRPRTVKVGHTTYSIDWVDEKSWLANEDSSKGGMSWAATTQIKIRLGSNGSPINEQVLREVLLHEILHTCWNDGNMDFHGSVDKDELEEWVIGCLTLPLIQALQDNPEVTRYIVTGV